MLKGKIKFRYSWVIIALMFATMFLSLGFCSSGRSMYLKAITEALEIPRSAFSINNTIRFATSTVVSLFFGSLVKRFGTKTLLCGGFLSLIVFTTINSYASELWQFYIGSIFLGIGISWNGSAMVGKVVNVWCEKNKATVMGIVMAANGIGGAFSAQIVTPIIFQENNPFGYRESYRMISVILAIMLGLILIFYRNPPEGKEIDLSRKKKKSRGEGWVGMEYREAVKTPYFYVMIIVLLFSGIVIKGSSDMVTPHLYDIGISEHYVATVSGIAGIVLSVAKILTGFFYDRFGIRFSSMLCLSCALLSKLLLLLIDTSPLGYVLVIVRSLIGCFASPLETVMLPIFASEFFGDKSFDKMVGIYVAISSLGGAVGAPVGNLFYDMLGSYGYQIVFFVSSVIMAIAMVAMHYAIRSSARVKKEILARLEAEENAASAQ